MNGAWKTIGVALEATTAGYTGGMMKAAAVTDKFGESAARARVEAEKPPSAAGWEAFATKTQTVGKSMTKNLTVPILAFGAAAVASAVQVDGAYHTIEQRTGATGAKLQGLKHDFDEVNKTSGASMAHIADVMSQANQRLGLTGAPLQAFTKDFLVLERVAGTGAPTIEQATTVMVAWKVATGDQASTLDKLFVASQRTGVPMNTLIDDVTRFAPQMRAANVSLDDSVVIMGSLEKAGVPVSKVFMGINTYLSSVAKSGGDTHGAFQKIIEQAAQLDHAGQRVQATTVLVGAFGYRAGLVISQMVADGKLAGPEFDALARQIAGADGQIQKVGDATIPLSVRLKQAWKSIELAIAPIGQVILPDLMDALHGVVPVVEGIAGALDKLPHGVQVWGVGLLGAAALAGPLLTVGGKVVTMAASIGSAMTTAGLEVSAFAESAVVEMGAVEAAIGLVLLPLVALGAGWYAWDQDSKERAADAKRIKDWSRSVIDDVKATGVSVKAAFATDVLSKFDVDRRAALEAHGITMSKITDGLASNGTAWTKWKSQVDDALGVHGLQRTVIDHAIWDEMKQAYDNATAGTRGLSTEQAKVVTALTATGASMRSATTDAQLLDRAVGDKGFKKSLDSATLSQDQFAAGARTMGQSVKDAIASFKADPKAWKQQLDDTYKFMKQVSDNFSSSGALTSIPDDLVKKGAAGLKLYYTQALQTNQKFSDNLRTATANGLNPQAITDLMVAGPQKAGPILEQLAGKHGQTLINMVNVFQAAIAKQTILAADQARILFAATQGPNQSQQMVRDTSTAFQVSAITNAGATPTTPEELMKRLGIDRKTLDRVSTEFSLNIPVSADMTKVQDDLKRLWVTISNTKTQVPVGAATSSGLRSLRSLKDEIDGSQGTVTILGNKDQADFKLAAVLNAINSGKGWVGIDADTAAALAKLGQITTTINGIPFVGSILAAHLFATANAAQVQRATTGPQVKNAHGNVFEDHSPQIAPAGAWRVWAEPETGGESYIPHALSKRARSIDLWKKTGMILGVRGFADGGTAWVDGNAVAAPAERALGDFVTWEQAMAASAAPGTPWNGSVGSVAAMQSFMAAQAGKPYRWGASGPDAYDCSGYWSAGWNVLTGHSNPYFRVFTSASLPGAARALGLAPGGGGPVSIGDKPGSHVAGTINGVNYEATPPFVRMGPSARGSGSPFFSRQFHIGGGAGTGGGFGAPSAAGGDPGASLFGNGGIVWHGKNFDVGGPLWPGWNAVRNDTGRVEHVVPTAPGGSHVNAAPISNTVVFNISANSDGQVEAIIRREVIPTLKAQYGEFVATVRRKESSMS